jgi:phenylpropionate dioxygenase-like ring-hydroxylating dioxygenase large terminal subunit
MSALDHWHPMMPSSQLRNRPIGVRLEGRDIALFRTESGQVGALDDICPHRRMRLSLGRVIGERLECKYHGWTFDCEGNGTSPGTPKMHACASTFDACEKYGYVWVKSKRSAPVMPTFDVDGWCHMCTMEHVAHGPLELVLDNFTEIEHTSVNHRIFGFRLQKMQEVAVRCDATKETVHVAVDGPAKVLSPAMRLLLGVGKNYVFNDDWTTYFSPIYSVFDHFWTSPSTGKEALVKWRVILFFVPADEKVTRIVSFTYAKSRWPVPFEGGLHLFRRFTRWQVDHEIKVDIGLIENLASDDVDLNGMKLSRFDRTLGLNRERIERIYRDQKLLQIAGS